MADLIDRQEVLNVIFNIMTDKKIKHKHRALNRNIKQLKIVNKKDEDEPICWEDKLDIDYIDEGSLNYGIITGLCFMNTNTQFTSGILVEDDGLSILI